MNRAGIYQIVNTINNHRYIGSAVNLGNRFRQHRSRLRRGIHGNAHLQCAWNKYGEQVFEFWVIGTCPPENLIRMEQHILDDLRPEYNISMTAGSNLGLVWPPEARARMSEAHKGKTRSPEHRTNMGLAHKGRALSFEHRSRISEANKGRIFSSEHRAKLKEASRRRWAGDPATE